MTELVEDALNNHVYGLSPKELGVLRGILRAHKGAGVRIEFTNHALINVYHGHVHIDGILTYEELAALDVFMAVRANDSTIRA